MTVTEKTTKHLVTKTTAGTIARAMLQGASDDFSRMGRDGDKPASSRYINMYLKSGMTGEQSGKVERAGVMHRSGMRWVIFPEGLTVAEGSVVEKVMMFTSPDSAPSERIALKVKDAGNRFPFTLSDADRKLLKTFSRKGRGFTVDEANLVLANVGDGFSIEAKPVRTGSSRGKASVTGEALKVDALDFLDSL